MLNSIIGCYREVYGGTEEDTARFNSIFKNSEKKWYLFRILKVGD